MLDVVGRGTCGLLSWEGLQVRHFLTCCCRENLIINIRTQSIYIYIPDDCRTGSKHISFCAFFEGGKSSHHFEYGGFTELAAVWVWAEDKKKNNLTSGHRSQLNGYDILVAPVFQDFMVV